MYVTDESAVNHLNVEGNPVRLSNSVTKFAKSNSIPGHIVSQYFQKAPNISGLVQHHLKREVLCQFIQLGGLQFYPHNFLFISPQRVMGLEPTTTCLGSKHSTAELHPQKLYLILTR